MPPSAIHMSFYTWMENWYNAAVAFSTWRDAFVLFVVRPFPDPLMPSAQGRSPWLIGNRWYMARVQLAISHTTSTIQRHARGIVNDYYAQSHSGRRQL